MAHAIKIAKLQQGDMTNVSVAWLLTTIPQAIESALKELQEADELFTAADTKLKRVKSIPKGKTGSGNLGYVLLTLTSVLVF
jgi:hypothetical protein